ncbi:uncharacterized protein LOC121368300 [Gigantopelta aegis]|uniref:uncharacterized protein LOC121368300 n=1 Tax=Gigantopelta aegis TaxID=1735272 RepID=UPI001B88D110|nr:uncharacterized protein LOC121368300 [Gigantopelta aegis]
MCFKIQTVRYLEYLSPGISEDFFDMIKQYLDIETGRQSVLSHEELLNGWSVDDDPFSVNNVDVAFVESSYFLELVKKKDKFVQLCSAAPVHLHSRTQNKPYYFSDIVVHSDKISRYKELNDLRGYRWAYNEENSLSGCLIVLAELNRMGTGSYFFGNILQSGSHLNSINMILDNIVDAAAIDSTVLNTFKKLNPNQAAKLHTLESLGPLPIHPIVFNRRLPACFKKKITKALLEMNRKPLWKSHLLEFDVTGFVPIDISLYNLELQIKEEVKFTRLRPTYY